jgi:hypothetical protein
VKFAVFSTVNFAAFWTVKFAVFWTMKSCILVLGLSETSAKAYYFARHKRQKTALFTSNAMENLNVTNDTGRPFCSVSNMTVVSHKTAASSGTTRDRRRCKKDILWMRQLELN